jgi:hypothetical protein
MSQNLSYQQRRAARLDDPAFEYLRNPRTRRRLAYGLIVLLVVEAATFALASVLPVVLFVAIVAVLACVMVMLLGALKASTRGIEELSPDVLDERQAQLRGEIFKRSYWGTRCRSPDLLRSDCDDGPTLVGVPRRPPVYRYRPDAAGDCDDPHPGDGAARARLSAGSAASRASMPH